MIRAGFGIRLGAAAIDAVAMYLSSSLVSGAFVAYLILSQRVRPAGPPASQPTFVWMFGVTGLVWLAYSLTEVFGAASPAKRLLKLRIVTVDHEPAPAGRRLARWAVKFGPVLLYDVAMTAMFRWALTPGGPKGPPPVFVAALNLVAAAAALAVLGGFFVVLGAQRRALHDLIAGTVVVRPGEAAQGFAPVMPVAPTITNDRAAVTGNDQ
jgi:uncharacterized RDD family membrane protein YckC